ncbi:MAG: hypothetical protein AABM42_13750, partial [Actinomycetota bacterium]
RRGSGHRSRSCRSQRQWRPSELLGEPTLADAGLPQHEHDLRLAPRDCVLEAQALATTDKSAG